ncbi:hypothetical protein GE09DRAFT_1113621 [Coniochaeta sp. 2T2.1]|nr:hypothetical protein GE09DRAFT_1113621 [Coniochaeta sp. 2T2.1]
MVMLFQGTQDIKPVTILIEIALRLAHELRLHARRAEFLETDISMRTSRPPVQREADIDLEWPSLEPEDGAGNVTDADVIFQFNFLRCRVRLARIQGLGETSS